MNNELFEKTKENVRKHRDSKFAINEAKKNYLVSELSHKKFFFRKLLAIEMKKPKYS